MPRLGIVYCTCGTCLRPSRKNRKLNKERFDVLSIPNYVIKKGPSHGARHGPTERQRIYYKTHGALRKAKKHGHKTISDRFLTSPRYRDSQTNTGCDENICDACDVIASEDHSHIATRWERSRNENYWKLVLNSEGAKDLWFNAMTTKKQRKLVIGCKENTKQQQDLSTQEFIPKIMYDKPQNNNLKDMKMIFLLYWFRNWMENILFLLPPRVNTIHPEPEIHEHFMIQKGYGTLCTTSSTLSPTLRPL